MDNINQGSSKTITFTCERCGNQFDDFLSNARRFCSKECADKFRSDNATCYTKEHIKEKRLLNIKNIRESHRKYNESHKDKTRAYSKKYSIEHPEIVKKSSRNRRAKLNSIIEKFTQKEWLDKVNKTKGICPGCGELVGCDKMTLDHIWPLCKAEPGRIYTIDDVQPLCAICNARKSGFITGQVSKDDLMNYLIKMRDSPVVLTEESLNKIKQMKWDNPVALIQFVFSQGFKGATDNLLKNMR